MIGREGGGGECIFYNTVTNFPIRIVGFCFHDLSLPRFGRATELLIYLAPRICLFNCADEVTVLFIFGHTNFDVTCLRNVAYFCSWGWGWRWGIFHIPRVPLSSGSSTTVSPVPTAFTDNTFDKRRFFLC